ncbi:MAG: AAA family ATPase [Myxococcales bacterium]|nr:AAA family ATPase [Myxococcales bacterium]
MEPFLERLAGLWARERATVTARAVAARRESTLAERVARGDALQSVEVDEVEVAPGDRTRLWLRRPPGGELRLRPGTPVRLWWTDPDDRDAVRGLADRVRGDRVAITVDGEVPDRILHGHFHVDLDDPQTVFTIGAGAIRWFQNARPREPEARLGAVLWGDEAPTFQAPAPWLPADAGLNASQRAAVDRALGAERLALVHGPPGTGKTRTLVEVIVQAVRRGQRVLACAMSNTATDHLAAGLIAAGLPIVRLGHPTRVAAAVEARSLDALLDASDARRLANGWTSEARRLRDRAYVRRDRGSLDRGAFRDALAEARRLERDARDHVRRAQGAILQSASVLCATATGAQTAVPRDLTFDVVVLDEATQAPDPLALAAFGRAPIVILAGDPEQLPPTVIDPDVEREGLGSTFFERVAQRWPEAVALLAVQYRMHADLMAFPARTRYGGRLTAPPDVAARTLADLGVRPDESRPTPLVLVDMAGKGCEDATDLEGSAYNDGQADRTVAEVRRLLSRGLAPADLAVITPYNAQRRRLRDALAPELAAGLEIGTVDGFQGREKEAIVVDLVRSNDQGQVGFVADHRRLNVAFTRAKRLLLVIADTATLGQDAGCADFLEEVEARGTWLSAWADEAEPLDA